MCTTAAPAGCWWPSCFPLSVFQLLQPGDGEIHNQPIYWILIGPLMLGSGPASMALCSMLTKGTWWYYSHVFPAILLTWSSFQTSFSQGNSPGPPPLSFNLQVSMDTSVTPTFQGFLALTATPFLPSIFSLFFWHLSPVAVWSLQQSFLLTLPTKKVHPGLCSLLPPATVSSGHSSPAQVLSCSLSLFHL